jgi:hypothetical protein
VHESQQSVPLEYLPVKQTFQYYFMQGTDELEAGKTFSDPDPVGLIHPVIPACVLHGQESHQKNQSQCKWQNEQIKFHGS